jgi:hypothetical protein
MAGEEPASTRSVHIPLFLLVMLVWIRIPGGVNMMRDNVPVARRPEIDGNVSGLANIGPDPKRVVLQVIAWEWVRWRWGWESP